MPPKPPKPPAEPDSAGYEKAMPAANILHTHLPAADPSTLANTLVSTHVENVKASGFPDAVHGRIFHILR